MLVISRKPDEGVVVRDRAGNLLGRVQVVEIRGGKVRLGFTFDKNEFPILRDEIDGVPADPVPTPSDDPFLPVEDPLGAS